MPITKAMFKRNGTLFFQQHPATTVCTVMRSLMTDAKLCGIGARVVNMLPLYCYHKSIELLSCGAAALTESCLRTHIYDPNAADACCRAVQNLTLTGAGSIFNEEEHKGGAQYVR